MIDYVEVAKQGANRISPPSMFATEYPLFAFRPYCLWGDLVFLTEYVEEDYRALRKLSAASISNLDREGGLVVSIK